MRLCGQAGIAAPWPSFRLRVSTLRVIARGIDRQRLAIFRSRNGEGLLSVQKKLSAEHRDSPLVVRLIFLGFLSRLVVCLFYSPCSIPLAFRLTKDRPRRRVLNKDGKETASMEIARVCAWLTHNHPEHPPTKKISPILRVISNHAPIRNLSPIVFAQLPFGLALQHRRTLYCDPRLPSHYPLLLSKALE